ncbi:phage baseplate assembly protein [Haemophilus influenzae]|uniref:phage baseplate assembly protein n=1 Tax=Haemophilus influenzae TaxID=727 RepID=UPI000D015D2A|nr:phage tail protein [Haemophilus influenzae]PRJ95172.1 Phage late control gene D protein [Haemophilus influenzae]PRK53177.1 Phage late control gene D protein [Haemophilus influenzae]
MSASGLKVEVIDPYITRYRPMVIIADDNMTGTSGYQRAMWELKRNKAEAQKSTATVQGWQKPDGSLWLPNEIVWLTAPELGFERQARLIVEVVFTLDENGTRSQLTLMHRDAFDEPDESLDKVQKGKKSKKSKKDNVTEFTDFKKE